MARKGERRKDPRVQWNTPGQIRLHGVPVVTLPCVVHDLSNTGARITTTLIAALQDRGLKRGVASLCIGGGEATAVAVELV